jgi:predicted thioesterase
MELKAGSSFEIEMTVEEKDTAVSYGSGSLRVFATPAMTALMEKAALQAAAPYLDEGYTTVGTKLDISHMAATPAGMKVRARAELTKVDGRRLTFRVEAYDEADKIGEGIHERYIVNAESFTERVYKKLPAAEQ